MNKEYLSRLNRDETKRVLEITTKWSDKRDFDADLLFRNRSISKAVRDGDNALLGGYAFEVLPSLTVFYPRIVLELCPSCKPVKTPRLLEEYLERDLLIPVLVSPYHYYPVDFAETILKYPHVSVAEYQWFRAWRLSRPPFRDVCPHCEDRFMRRYVSLLGASQNKLLAGAIKNRVRAAFDDLFPILPPDGLLIDELNSLLDSMNARRVEQVLSLIACVGTLKHAQAFSAVPQMSIRDLDVVERIGRTNPALGISYDVAEVRESIMQGIGLAYDPSAPLKTYFDIVVPRRSKISEIVSAIIKRSRSGRNIDLSKLSKEIQKINEEIRSIKSSKRATALKLTTSFVSHNRGLIAGCLVGSMLGLAGFGIIGCGSGLAAGFGAKILKKYGQIRVPEPTRAIERKLLEAMEPGYERILSHYLSKNLDLIQVWQLQEKLASGQL